jgi:putative membrane-bound dehydrogenase-like protein
MRRFGFTLIAGLFVASGSLYAAPSTQQVAELPRAKPMEVPQAMASIKLHPGLALEAAASEPMVESPIDIDFDEDGGMYVVEMRDYPDRREEKLGRIVRLESSKGDGIYDRKTVFVDGLPWPSSVCCWDGGVFVLASPDLFYFKDTKGTGTADVKKLIMSGFGNRLEKLNVQGLVNGLTVGLDGRIYGTSSENGGVVSMANGGSGIDLREKGFSFDPRKLDLREENGGGQYGISFDDENREFVCSNSRHLMTFLFDNRYAGRNPLVVMPPSLVDIGVDGPAAEVYRISAEEQWRVIRTNWRVAGVVSGPVEGGGRSSGYFTSASGVCVYRGDALPKEYYGNAFIAEPAGNLVSRKVLHRDGIDVIATRAPEEQKAECFASTDQFCRPVQVRNGPDGALYVVDMYREIIEHPWSLPDSLKSRLDLHSGENRGRIWRIMPEHFQRPAMPHLSNATTQQLVELLGSPNGWMRSTASRLLNERHDTASVALLKPLLANPGPQGLAAIWLLDGLSAAGPEELTVAMANTNPAIRAAALKLTEALLAQNPSASLLASVQKLTDDPDQMVRMQVAFSLGAIDGAAKVEPLARIARKDGDNSMIRAAISNAAAGQEAQLCRALAADAKAAELVAELAQTIGAMNKPADVAVIMDAVQKNMQESHASAAFALLTSLRQGQKRSSEPPSEQEPRLKDAITQAKRADGPEADRVVAIKLLATFTYATAGPSTLDLLEPSQPGAVQSAAISALGEMNAREVGPALVKRFKQLSPKQRSEALDILIRRPDRAMALLNGISNKQVRVQDIPSTKAMFLRNHRDAQVQALARKLLIPPTGTRDDVIAQYRSALALPGDAKAGKLVYEQRCISCHRVAGEGSAVGPDLMTVRAAGKEKMLVNIIDPNREVAPNFLAYVVNTRDGESLTGIIANETASSITVRQAYGKDSVVLRSQVKSMDSQRLSLMPEGIEAGLKPQDFANLLEFLTTAPAEKK